MVGLVFVVYYLWLFVWKAASGIMAMASICCFLHGYTEEPRLWVLHKFCLVPVYGLGSCCGVAVDPNAVVAVHGLVFGCECHGGTLELWRWRGAGSF